MTDGSKAGVTKIFMQYENDKMPTMTIQGRLLSALTETEVALFTDGPTLVHFKFKCAAKASAK